MDGDQLWIGTYTGKSMYLTSVRDISDSIISTWEVIYTIDGTSCYTIFKDETARYGRHPWMESNGITERRTTLPELKSSIRWQLTSTRMPGEICGSLPRKRTVQIYDPVRKTWKQYAHSKQEHDTERPGEHCDDRQQRTWCGWVRWADCAVTTSADCFVRIPLDIPSLNINSIMKMTIYSGWPLTTDSSDTVRVNRAVCIPKWRTARNDQFMPNAGLKASDGRIYIGSVNGFNAFYPYQIMTNRVVPKVYITGLEIFNKSVPTGRIQLPQTRHYIKEPNLSHDDNVLRCFTPLWATVTGKEPVCIYARRIRPPVELWVRRTAPRIPTCHPVHTSSCQGEQ